MSRLRDLLRRATAAWNLFWFAAIDARTYAAMRITLGLLLLGNHVLLAPELTRVLGPQGYYPLSVAVASGARERWSLFDYPTDEGQLWLVFWLGCLPMVGMILGFQSRLMTLLAMAVEISVHHRSPWIQHGGDRVLRLSTLSLALAPSGAAWSIDAWWAARRRAAAGDDAPRSALAPIWVNRLIQIQLVVIYVATGVLKEGGSTWQNGTALFYALSSQNFQRAPALTDALLDHRVVHWLASLGTWVTLGWELSFGLLVLWRPTRWLALVLGLALHMGIFSTMMVGAFSPAMVWCYQAFFTVPLLLWRPEIRRAIGLPR
jgi:hypothetical protein